MKQNNTSAALTRLSETYIRLVLSVGGHDSDYVDAYYGPESLKGDQLPLAMIRKRAAAAIAELKTLSPTRMDGMVQLRHQYLLRQLQSLVARVEMLTVRR